MKKLRKKGYIRGKHINCNETHCPDYLICYYYSLNDELNKCEKRELEYNNLELENKKAFIMWLNEEVV